MTTPVSTLEPKCSVATPFTYSLNSPVSVAVLPAVAPIVTTSSSLTVMALASVPVKASSSALPTVFVNVTPPVPSPLALLIDTSPAAIVVPPE